MSHETVISNIFVVDRKRTLKPAILKVFDSPAGLYHYKLLPGFAQFILEHHLEEFGRLQYDLSHKVNLPLLQHLKQYSREHLLEITKGTNAELLQFLIDNRAKEQIETSLQRWLSNQLEVIQSMDVIVEDITVLNYIRNEAFKHFIPLFTADLQTAIQLTSEIDSFLVGSTTSSMDTYIDMLKEQISKKEEQLLEAQTIAHIGSYDWDIVANKTIDSPELCRIFEIDKARGLEPWMNGVHPEDIEKVTAALNEAFQTGDYECEFRFIAGESVKTIWARGVVSFKEGKAVRMIGSVQDISDRKVIEETLLLKTIELERSNEELQHFASVASHDLKEPLRKIRMFSHVLSGVENMPPESIRHIDKIEDAAKRMNVLIDDILTYSSLNQQQLPQSISLQKLGMEVVELLDHRLKEKNAVVELENLPDAIVIPFQFRQLFQNLITNSLKFSQPDIPPLIMVRAEMLSDKQVEQDGLQQADSYLQLEFHDNGIGFEQANADKIFGIFNRLHNKSQYEGTGLGLSICRKVAENHGGIITAQSCPGEGANFRVLIPQQRL
ncbi:MAG: domain S-box protein [Flaviaesturariibacter sp.]|nr:domain S-box protein [Flaviaesturariibacter sp.]